MQRLARQVLIRLVIVFAVAVGLARPPFGSDAHAASSSTTHLEAVQKSDARAAHDHHSGYGHSHDDGSDVEHDASDHSHLPSSLPPSVMGLALSSEWTRLADLEAATPRSATISFDRPPKPTVFA